MQAEQAGLLLEQTLLQSLAVGAEGLMLKFLDSRCAYQPSKRSDSWLKLKKDYCEGLRDSLDLVRLHPVHHIRCAHLLLLVCCGTIFCSTTAGFGHDGMI